MAQKKDKKYGIGTRLSRQVVEAFTLSAYARGALTEDDLKDIGTLMSKQLKHMKGKKISFVINFAGEIKEQAKLFHDNEKYEYAIMFYALYFEHTMNSIINIVLTRQSFPKKQINEILRSVNIQGKLNWLPELIGLSPINAKHAKIIKQVSEERNSFVHYKYNPVASDDASNKEKLRALLTNAQKTAKYLAHHEARILYKKKKGTIKTLLRLPKKRKAKKSNNK